MSINITVSCHRCHRNSIVKNGKKRNGTQNYRCKDCERQFISDHERIYSGTIPGIADKVKIMLVRGSGIRDIGEVLGISMNKVLTVIASTSYEIRPHRKHYGCLEVDEFWTYVGSKQSKVWLIAD